MRSQMRDIRDPEPADAPSHCPTCRSREVITTSKVANADSYWRCAACGEVWNAARLKAGARYRRDSPFQR